MLACKVEAINQRVYETNVACALKVSPTSLCLHDALQSTLPQTVTWCGHEVERRASTTTLTLETQIQNTFTMDVPSAQCPSRLARPANAQQKWLCPVCDACAPRPTRTNVLNVDMPRRPNKSLNVTMCVPCVLTQRTQWRPDSPTSMHCPGPRT